MSARIARIYKNAETLENGAPNPAFDPKKPLMWMEYYDQPNNKFVTQIDDSTLFPSHGVADDLAIIMRAKANHGYVFAQTEQQQPPPTTSIAPRIRRPRRESEEEHTPHVKLFGYED